MSKMMIYALLGTIGGAVENVWGHQMQVDTIDPTDKDAVEKAKADGWTNKPQDVIEQIEVKKMQSQNAAMQSQVDSAQSAEKIKALEAEVSELKAKLEVYEKPKDTNGDGQISYDEMTKDELQVLLDQRKVEYVARDSKDVLIQKAKDSE